MKEIVEIRIKRQEYRGMRWEDIPMADAAFDNEEDGVVKEVNTFLDKMLFTHNLVSPPKDHIIEIRWNFRGCSQGHYVSNWFTAVDVGKE